MSFDKKLLDIVCCPVTHLPLRLMSEAELLQLNSLIEAGTLKSRDSARVVDRLSEALVTDDGRLAYPIRDDIPVLLEEKGIVIGERDGA